MTLLAELPISAWVNLRRCLDCRGPVDAPQPTRRLCIRCAAQRQTIRERKRDARRRADGIGTYRAITPWHLMADPMRSALSSASVAADAADQNQPGGVPDSFTPKAGG